MTFHPILINIEYDINWLANIETSSSSNTSHLVMVYYYLLCGIGFCLQIFYLVILNWHLWVHFSTIFFLILILKITLWIVLSLVRVILLTGMPHKSFASNAKRLLSRKYFKSFENISLTESQPWSPQCTRKFIVYTCFSIRMQYMALNQNQDSHTPTVLCWSKKQRARTITQRRKKISIRERND